MEIHRPKAIHGLRELAKEIAIIVVGVLIALGAEQAVEALHWAHLVADAEDAMRVELRHGERDAYYRLAIRPCAVAQLDGIERALAASRDRGTPVAAIAPYRRPRRPWQSDAWDSARALQITGHMPTARLSAWSQAYFFAEVLHATQPQERAALSEINTLTLNAGRLQPAERDRLYGALVRARAADRHGPGRLAADPARQGAGPSAVVGREGRRARLGARWFRGLRRGAGHGPGAALGAHSVRNFWGSMVWARTLPLGAL